MTIQCLTPGAAVSKATLQAALNSDPGKVKFREPTPTRDRLFSGADWPHGMCKPVVMDPATRRRFSMVERLQDGTFRVSGARPG